MTDHRPRVLLELDTELERVAPRALSGASSERTRRRSPRWRFALSLTALAAAGVFAFIVGFNGRDHVAGRARLLPAGNLALDAAFVVLRRPARAGDGLPDSELHFFQEHSTAFHIFGLEPARSRRIVVKANVTVWLVPGPRELCLVGVVGEPIADGGSGASYPVGCDTADSAKRNGMIGTFGDMVAGVLPAGSNHVEAVVRDGRTTAVRLTEGEFAFPYRRQDLPLDVDYVDPTGARQQFYVPPPHARVTRHQAPAAGR